MCVIYADIMPRTPRRIHVHVHVYVRTRKHMRPRLQVIRAIRAATNMLNYIANNQYDIYILTNYIHTYAVYTMYTCN